MEDKLFHSVLLSLVVAAGRLAAALLGITRAIEPKVGFNEPRVGFNEPRVGAIEPPGRC